jgi:acyl carrier protein
MSANEAVKSRERIRAAVYEAILAIAPEADLEHVRPDGLLREQLDIDSFDFLNVLVGIHKSIGIDIPEVDYAKVATLKGMLDYVAERLERS